MVDGGEKEKDEEARKCKEGLENGKTDNDSINFKCICIIRIERCLPLVFLT